MEVTNPKPDDFLLDPEERIMGLTPTGFSYVMLGIAGAAPIILIVCIVVGTKIYSWFKYQRLYKRYCKKYNTAEHIWRTNLDNYEMNVERSKRLGMAAHNNPAFEEEARTADHKSDDNPDVFFKESPIHNREEHPDEEDGEAADTRAITENEVQRKYKCKGKQIKGKNTTKGKKKISVGNGTVPHSTNSEIRSDSSRSAKEALQECRVIVSDQPDPTADDVPGVEVGVGDVRMTVIRTTSIGSVEARVLAEIDAVCEDYNTSSSDSSESVPSHPEKISTTRNGSNSPGSEAKKGKQSKKRRPAPTPPSSNDSSSSREDTGVGREKLNVGQERLNVGQEKQNVGQEKQNVGQEKQKVGQEKQNIGHREQKSLKENIPCTEVAKRIFRKDKPLPPLPNEEPSPKMEMQTHDSTEREPKSIPSSCEPSLADPPNVAETKNIEPDSKLLSAPELKSVSAPASSMTSPKLKSTTPSQSLKGSPTLVKSLSPKGKTKIFKSRNESSSGSQCSLLALKPLSSPCDTTDNGQSPCASGGLPLSDTERSSTASNNTESTTSSSPKQKPIPSAAKHLPRKPPVVECVVNENPYVHITNMVAMKHSHISRTDPMAVHKRVNTSIIEGVLMERLGIPETKQKQQEKELHKENAPLSNGHAVKETVENYNDPDLKNGSGYKVHCDNNPGVKEYESSGGSDSSFYEEVYKAHSEINEETTRL